MASATHAPAPGDTQLPVRRPPPPRGVLPLARAFLSGFMLRCPMCGKGSLFAGPLSYRRVDRCDACGVTFMPDEGEITGGMAMNMVLTSILGIVGVVYLAFFSQVSPTVAVAWLVLAPLLFGLWFHRHAHGLWVAALYATRSTEERHPLASQGRLGGDPRLRARPAPRAGQPPSR